jgi:RsiW-degrading membrane proteinase PrsW (M82 family)
MPYSFSSLVPIRHWARDPASRSWPVLLLIALVCVPTMALMLVDQQTITHFKEAGWILACYFAIGWLVLLAVVVRPQHVTRTMLAAVTGIAIATQTPFTVWLETRLHDHTTNLPASIFTVGVPEELAKALPVLVAAWIWRRQWHTQNPCDYLFLGAVSGLVFGAAEAIHYFTVTDVNIFKQTVQSDIPAILQLINAGYSKSASVFYVLIFPVWHLILQVVWRFLTDPISHACWAGITGYFIGLAITGRVPRYQVGLAGICIAAVLHGLNDWTVGNPAWVLVVLMSVVLFLGYAMVGARMPEPLQATAGQGPMPGGPWSGAPGTAGPSGPADRARRAGPWASPGSAAPPPVPGQAAPGSPRPAYTAAGPRVLRWR